MSSEPSASGKCVLYTTKGELQIELWAKECPKTVRSFLQSIQDGKWDGIVLGKVAEDAVWAPAGLCACSAEINGRLRFNRRGLVGMAPGQDQPFFTLASRGELDGRAVVFGTLVGQSVYRLMEIAQGEVGDDGKTFVYPAEVRRAEVTIPYFDGLSGQKRRAEPEQQAAPRPRKIATRVRLEYEESEDEASDPPLDVRIRAAHDILQDERLTDALHGDSPPPRPAEAPRGSDSAPCVASPDRRAEAAPPTDGPPSRCASLAGPAPASPGPVTDLAPQLSAREQGTLSSLAEFRCKRGGKNPLLG
ncbi:ADR044Cp [Eremothecium gossypii ATCC 10895]|uniref:Peptidyl-prolyl isomerase CWC27 n=1 Tax=Eremothecium gossypii (strain ATCC 10895 / CBS 109.51 / FGSC 9923 / NRRL Y-1056) TaxID=284811 RepID=CWC27_EREGS|nr:ADR044Cp [Eremothecium gossypii ATCC 10895]Q75A74.1 RecName: Full=Peptidyl-prolyl isomerase CWC27; Short=PPIase CWC27; AltName: Full=Rotamase CWC27 [Eremothecium gossypii ATCC 10895]AAS51964.1 ADR044Cp [Eremothecium gossypii ATCC 10895]